jgi:hypothetical protein
MKKFTILIAMLAVPATLALGTASTANADTPVTNFGCVAQLANNLGVSPSSQAPGRTGNGPLVVLADGTVHTSPAFEGSVGC